MDLRRRATSMVVNVLCVTVSLLALGFVLPAAFGLQRYAIAGGSMTGSISRGSVVLEEVVPVSDLRVGDVITYLPPADSGVSNLVTHRIVAIRGDELRTQGDANPDRDPWTFRLTAATQPRVVMDVPLVGWVFLALQERQVRMLAIGVPAGLVALLSLAQLVGALRRRPDSETPEVAVEGTPVVALPRQRPAEVAGGRPARPARTAPAAPPAPVSSGPVARTTR